MKFLHRIEALRPANLLLLLALPFLIWLFATSTDYTRSLAAILGVERGSAAQFPGFLLLLVVFAAPLASLFTRAKVAVALATLGIGAGLALCLTPVAHPFLTAAVANAVDPATSPLVVPAETPRRLTEAAAAAHSRADIEFAERLGNLQRLPHDHARYLPTEITVDVAVVDGDIARTRCNEDARGGGLATASSVIG